MAIGGRRRHTALQNIDPERAPSKGMDGFIAPRASGGLLVVWMCGWCPVEARDEDEGFRLLLSCPGLLAMPCGRRDEGQKRTTDGS